MLKSTFLRRSNINRRRRRSSLFDITTESVIVTPIDEKNHQEHKFQPLFSPAQLPLAENSMIGGPQVFLMTVCPVAAPLQIDNSMEKSTSGHLVQINYHDSAGIVHQVPILPAPAQTRMADLNLNQRLSEDPSPLSLNLSLSLDQVQHQYSKQSNLDVMPSFNNGDSMISVA